MAHAHTYDHACRLAPVVEPNPDNPLLDGIPPIHAQFFYHSLIPIDDPLSTATAAPGSEHKPAKTPLRPFSHADNNALERAWLQLSSSHHRSLHQASLANKSLPPALAAANSDARNRIVSHLIQNHREKHGNNNEGRKVNAPSERPLDALASNATPVCCQELLLDASNMLRGAFCDVTRRKQPGLDQEHVIERVMIALERERPTSIIVPPRAGPSLTTSSPRTDDFVLPALSTSARGRASSLVSDAPVSRSASTDSRLLRSAIATSASQSERSLPKPNPVPIRPPVVDDGICGQPFVRVETDVTDFSLESVRSPGESGVPSDGTGDDRKSPQRPTDHVAGREKAPRSVEVPVGISRLHMVTLPVLQMKPIYWSPVNDLAIVSRATWFYRDTMFPVESAIANQLEAGYRELRPYSQTWTDELRCAVDVGPEGEEKVSWPLWPKVVSPSSANRENLAEPRISVDPFCAAHCFRGEAATEGSLAPPSYGPAEASEHPPSYANHHVIYKDGTAAFLLKPSLKPSAYYGRRPVSKIIKGFAVGTPVVRGFDREAWGLLHEKTKLSSRSKISYGGNLPIGKCPGCTAEEDRGRVTELVLVAHGIGQKFAERVESYHFTHAVTALRRSINIELQSGTVKPLLRDGFNGIMVLPVNWRHTLSLEDGGPVGIQDSVKANLGDFALKDIEPDTIPAVRSLISDVMFDIPFYMSHHKPKMIQALVAEANRLYRLWCRNNPDFKQNGRVHLIAHSLGSVMALEVLSKQPSILPVLNTPDPGTSCFEFNTTNLFLLGSPAGFFLLLERGNLVPRRGRQKAGVEAGDIIAQDVVGEAGSFGCLAVDNIYNILAKEDPIAYLLNGTIDSSYADSLRTAFVPSTTSSWFKSMSDAVRGFIPVGSPPVATDLAAPVPSKPPTFRLPSQLELEVHDFTREEIAERKAFLLNDNGQVDFYLRSGTGPLELQYVNMLSAHTSYWMNKDLIRLLCVEVGRQPGREHTLPIMRAVKMTRRDRGVK